MTKNNINNFASYLVAPILSILIFCLYFSIYNHDLTTPILALQNDGYFYNMVSKMIVEDGTFFHSSRLSYPFEFYLHDFPLNPELINIFFIWIISFFSSDTVIIGNIFFILTFALISFTGFITLRFYKISFYVSVLISILYAFLPYHFFRGLNHLYLSNYAIIPLTFILFKLIINNQFRIIEFNEKKVLQLTPLTKVNFYSLLIIFLLALSGIYYLFFSLIVIFCGWFLNGLKENKFSSLLLTNCFILVLISLIITFIICIPNFSFWLKNNFNNHSLTRSPASSELFGFRIFDLFVPISNHFIIQLANFNHKYYHFFYNSERFGQGIGILGCFGIVYLLIYSLNNLFTNHRTLNKNKSSNNENNSFAEDINDLGSLNILTLLIITVSGLLMFLVIFFPWFRSHSRFVVITSFMAFIAVAMIFDRFRQKKFYGNKLAADLAILIICILALFDQVGNPSKKTAAAIDRFTIEKDFVSKVEKFLPNDSAIFIFPTFGFPEANHDDYDSLIYFIFSNNLKLSYPALFGREAYQWQKTILKLDFDNFINELRSKKFNAILLDRTKFLQKYLKNPQKLIDLENKLRNISKNHIESTNLNTILFEI